MLIDGFKLTFGFEFEYLEIDDALEVIGTKNFEDGPLPLFNQPNWEAQLETALECYNLTVDEEEDPRNINIPKSEGSHEVESSKLEVPEITKDVKLKKVNIGTEEDPKIASIRDYWDDETIGHIVELLQEYQDLFPTKITNMKGILGDLGIIRIPLKEGAKSVKQCPYRLNPRYK